MKHSMTVSVSVSVHSNCILATAGGGQDKLTPTHCTEQARRKGLARPGDEGQVHKVYRDELSEGPRRTSPLAPPWPGSPGESSVYTTTHHTALCVTEAGYQGEA
jgi:hypothetical protein